MESETDFPDEPSADQPDGPAPAAIAEEIGDEEARLAAYQELAQDEERRERIRRATRAAVDAGIL